MSNANIHINTARVQARCYICLYLPKINVSRAIGYVFLQDQARLYTRNLASAQSIWCFFSVRMVGQKLWFLSLHE